MGTNKNIGQFLKKEADMNRFARIVIAGVLALAIMPRTATAVVIHESASLGATGQMGGYNLSVDQFLGSRFSITSSFQVTNVGGHINLLDPDKIFAAIVQLTSPTALPTGSPFAGLELLASTAFTPNQPSSDILTPLSVQLTAGDYALIFGSGTLGATGYGTMPRNNTDLPGFSYFAWGAANGWVEGGFDSTRFVVIGTSIPDPPAPIPEPTTITLFSIALSSFAIIRRRHRKFT